jgi:SP family myo-inositol transporter-like MFS transporter 13
MQYFSHILNDFLRYDDHTLSVVTYSLYLSAAFVAIIGGWAANKFGRKIVMGFSGFFFVLGTAITAASVAVGMMVLGRIVIGFGVGLASSTTPLFISEI